MPADDSVAVSFSLPRSQASALAQVVQRLVTANLTRINNRAMMPIATEVEIPDAELGLVALRDALDQAGFGPR